MEVDPRLVVAQRVGLFVGDRLFVGLAEGGDDLLNQDGINVDLKLQILFDQVSHEIIEQRNQLGIGQGAGDGGQFGVGECAGKHRQLGIRQGANLCSGRAVEQILQLRIRQIPHQIRQLGIREVADQIGQFGIGQVADLIGQVVQQVAVGVNQLLICQLLDVLIKQRIVHQRVAAGLIDGVTALANASVAAAFNRGVVRPRQDGVFRVVIGNGCITG